MKDKRNEMKMTIRGIAPVIGISWQHYSDIESGRKNPSADLTRVLADFFDVPMEKFFENIHSKKEQA
jgi:DNA-binding XRE family transcriptional regulator